MVFVIKIYCKKVFFPGRVLTVFVFSKCGDELVCRRRKYVFFDDNLHLRDHSIEEDQLSRGVFFCQEFLKPVREELGKGFPCRG